MTLVEPMGGGDDLVGIDDGFVATVNNGLLNQFHGVFGQQLQDTNVLSGSGHRAVTYLERSSQLLEAGRQRPAIKHRGMIQGRRSATENGQIMTGFDDPLISRVTASVRGDHAIGRDHIDPIDIRLDRHRREGPTTGNAVAIGVESHRLILVDLGRGWDEWIEGMGRQSQRGLFVLLEQLADRLGFAGHPVVPLGQSTRSQIGIEFGQVLHRRDRCGPIPL